MRENEAELDVAQYTASLFQEYEIREVKTLPIASQEVQEVLQKHGCIIENKEGMCLIAFPEGTKRKQIELTTHVEKYQITLPDGYVLRQEISRYKDANLLFYMPDNG